MRISTAIIFIFHLTFLFSCRQQTPSHPAGTTTVEIAYPFSASSEKFQHIQAHRGGGDLPGYPENCLESMIYINDKTGAWMEIDIRKTKDGQLVLMHDASVDRTTNGSGKVENLTLSALKKLKLKDNNGRLTSYHPPTLEEALTWNEQEGHTVLNLDIKQGVNYEDVIHLIHKTNQMDNVVGIVYNIDQAKAMRRKSREIVINVPVRNLDEWERLKKSGLSLKNLMAFTGTIRSPEVLYDTLHKNGMLAVFGAMGNIDRQAAARGSKVYQELYDNGVDILSTDRPLNIN